MEIFVLGLVFGAATAQGKAVTKAVAKGYMAVTEKTRGLVSNLKEDMRGAIEEARSQQDGDGEASTVAGHEAEALTLREHAEPKPAAASKATAVAAVASTVATSAAKAKPAVMRSLAKSYMAVTEKTRGAVSGLRENMRDAIEEARYERELAAKKVAEVAAEPVTAAPVAPEPRQKRKYTRTAPLKPRARAAAPAAVDTKPKAKASSGRTAAPKGAAAKSAAAKPSVAKAPASTRRVGRKQRANTTETLLEVAEIAADAL